MAFPLSDRVERQGDVQPFDEEGQGSVHNTTNESYSEDSLYDPEQVHKPILHQDSLDTKDNSGIKFIEFSEQTGEPAQSAKQSRR